LFSRFPAPRSALADLWDWSPIGLYSVLVRSNSDCDLRNRVSRWPPMNNLTDQGLTENDSEPFANPNRFSSRYRPGLPSLVGAATPTSQLPNLRNSVHNPPANLTQVCSGWATG